VIAATARIAYHRDMSEHQARILDQFTRQAVPFSTAPSLRDRALIALIVEASGVQPQQRVLDVACGPGLVVSAFAERAQHVTGIDVVPAMIERAGELLTGVANVELILGDVRSLPFADRSFEVVVSRFAFHHFQEPQAVLQEMRRVCKPGGRLVVADLLGSEDPAKASAFHALELRRDPSHARAHRLTELLGFFEGAGLQHELYTRFRLPFELEGLLARSFPPDGDRDALRAVYLQSLDGDGLGLNLERVGSQVHGAYDAVVVRATCPC
jgi:ubiquinone/menaquinone biosynthesis C-methylase UbiE